MHQSEVGKVGHFMTIEYMNSPTFDITQFDPMVKQLRCLHTHGS